MIRKYSHLTIDNSVERGDTCHRHSRTNVQIKKKYFSNLFVRISKLRCQDAVSLTIISERCQACQGGSCEQRRDIKEGPACLPPVHLSTEDDQDSPGPAVQDLGLLAKHELLGNRQSY